MRASIQYLQKVLIALINDLLIFTELFSNFGHDNRVDSDVCHLYDVNFKHISSSV